MARVLKDDNEGLIEAGRLLADGKLVAFPTETVYGLGADGYNSEAVKNIFLTKGRPQDNPLILHISEKKDIYKIGEDIPEYVGELIDHFWPGPLSIIVKARSDIPKATTAGLDTVAVRCPKSETARRIISNSGTAIAAPSANLSGRPSPTTFEDCRSDLKDKDVYIVEGKPTDIGIESTVVLCTDYPPAILRPGAITRDDIARLVGDCEVFAGQTDKPKSPGQKYGHYMAEKLTVLVDMSPSETDKLLSSLNITDAVYILSEDNRFAADKKIVLAKYDDPFNASNKYFHSLRMADAMEGRYIIVQAYSKDGIGSALFNRMIKSSAGRVLEVGNEDWIW